MWSQVFWFMLVILATPERKRSGGSQFKVNLSKKLMRPPSQQIR
jgi:hypothetical protein